MTSKPTLLLDVMSTLVTEPFLEAMPRFFGMTLDEFKAARHPAPWIEFEHGRITEDEYIDQYFIDGRTFDVSAFKAMLFDAYEWMDGVPELLGDLKAAGYDLYALSNYSVWYEIIEAKLGLSAYLGWDFVSCRTGHRKPAPEAYLAAVHALDRPPSSFVFVDDRQLNVDGAIGVGMQGILRTPDIESLRRDLRERSIAV